MKVGIIDYGASNLYSIDRSLRYLGANTLIIDEPSKLKEVDKLIFPGQGSLGSAMSHLKKIELITEMLNFVVWDLTVLIIKKYGNS